MTPETLKRECASMSANHAADTDLTSQAEANGLWIFGFGSLIWKAGSAVTCLKDSELWLYLLNSLGEEYSIQQQ